VGTRSGRVELARGHRALASSTIALTFSRTPRAGYRLATTRGVCLGYVENSATTGQWSENAAPSDMT
jgi:hypothetical protein